jgi:hypothetical protein
MLKLLIEQSTVDTEPTCSIGLIPVGEFKRPLDEVSLPLGYRLVERKTEHLFGFGLGIFAARRAEKMPLNLIGCNRPAARLRRAASGRMRPNGPFFTESLPYPSLVRELS